MTIFFEQTLNGVQFGIFLFLISAGLTLIFGIMGLINLAHGSLYMIGAFAGGSAGLASGSFLVGLAAAILVSAVVGVAIELALMRRLYSRNHLDQVLVTFGLILFFNEATTMIWGRTPIFVPTPDVLSGAVTLLPGIHYPVYRLFIIALGMLVAAGLWFVIARTRIGMWIRAGATHRETIAALGVDISLLNTLVFAAGATLAGLAGAFAGPLVSVQVGMGEQVLILAFVVVVIGGIGSIRGALIGALVVGLVDTWGRAFGPQLLEFFLPPADAAGVGAGLSSMGVYVLMAIVLIVRPRGLFPGRGT